MNKNLNKDKKILDNTLNYFNLIKSEKQKNKKIKTSNKAKDKIKNINLDNNLSTPIDNS